MKIFSFTTKKKTIMNDKKFIVEKKFICMTRFDKDKNFTECLLNFNSKFHSKTIPILKKKINFDIIYIYIDDIFEKELTNIHNEIKNISYENSLPLYDFTKNPMNVSFDCHEIWESIRFKAFVPTPSNDWDFFELEWLLKRFNTSLGFFDYDTFLIIPTYPKDLTNNVIHPDIVLYYIDRYKQKYSIQELKKKFYPLYLFWKDKLGRGLLHFFYNETIQPETNNRNLIQKIHKIYHSSSNNNPYKNYLFYNNYSLTNSRKMKFDIKKYILIFLSFHCCFLCLDYIQNRKEYIFDGIQLSSKLHNYLPFFPTTESIQHEMKKIHDHHGDILTWVSRNHFKDIKTDYAKYMYTNWYFIRRNINLLDIRVMNYPDTQTCYGMNLMILFRHDWVNHFHNKNYDFPEKSGNFKKKFRLKL